MVVITDGHYNRSANLKICNNSTYKNHTAFHCIYVTKPQIEFVRLTRRYLHFNSVLRDKKKSLILTRFLYRNHLALLFLDLKICFRTHALGAVQRDNISDSRWHQRIFVRRYTRVEQRLVYVFEHNVEY